MLRHDWLGSSWDGGAMQDDFNISIHALSNVLHYGQGLFEGLKAFHCHDGKVRVFNSGANAARLRSGCERLQMPVVPPELFNEAIDRVVKDNVEFVPPYVSYAQTHPQEHLSWPACRARVQPSLLPHATRRVRAAPCTCAPSSLATVANWALGPRRTTVSAWSRLPWERTTRVGSRWLLLPLPRRAL